MKKNLLMLLVLFLACSVVLAGCGNGNNGENAKNTNTANEPKAEEPKTEEPKAEEPAAVEPFTVSLRHIQIGDAQKNRKAILDDVVKKTEEEVPGLKFELDGVEDSVNRFTKLPAEMAAGNPPKIFDLFGGAGDALKFAKAGRLLDLTPIIEELGIKDKFLNLNQFTLDGKVYGLPIGGSSEGFYYNQAMFEKYGLKVPTTWAELETAAETLKKNNITPFASGSKAAWVPNMLVNTLIGRYAGPESIDGFAQGTAKWNSPEVVAAYAKYEEWVKKGYFTKGELGKEYADQMNEFVQGKAGMLFDGSWRSSVFKDEAQAFALTNKTGYFAMPAVDGGKGDQTFINGNYSNGYGFSADLKENELTAVKAFIKNLFNEEMQLRGLLEDGLLPSIQLSDAAMGQATDPIVKQVLDTYKNAKGAFSHFDSTIQSDVYKETEAELQKLIAGKTTAQKVGDAIQKAQDAANAKK
ncbi:sugar ABC transporter substrate-binding protein [Paenibacillus swuensis]|uniref:Sugar ABC transporter substrate-binding protein n=1 Tax=Paenibacillus swuensis TaxID=1178515 RepID=A0A172TJ08_9BACL|nr:extracellular solute-binding protein [Paenibacillus swuensis]ANE46946.1 sugar ABC transporter substrate-binding protein [Paenibacillus swuensis]